MTDGEEIENSLEEDTDLKNRITPPQREALRQIYRLNMAYPKRKFTLYEIDGVVEKTMLALLKKGYLKTELCKVNAKVRYFWYTQKAFDFGSEDIFVEFD
jgi:hypothetical protein